MHMLLQIFLFVIVGIVAGFCSGLFGIAGGIIVVPSLVLIFSYLDIGGANMMQIAIGTTLLSMVFTTLSSTLAHHRKHHIEWDIVLKMSLGIVLGAICGAFLAKSLPSETLKKAFGALLILFGAYLFVKPKLNDQKKPKFPSIIFLIIAGFIFSLISACLGIGGGLFVVAFLALLDHKMQKAIGTGAAVSLLVTFVGGITFALSAGNFQFVNNTFGYIYVPAFIALAISAALLAPLGAKATKHLHGSILRKLFGLLVVFVGLIMLFYAG